MYYALRERQLAYHYRKVARDDPATWRRFSVAASRPAALLAARGRAPLAILVPQTRCGVEAGDTAVLVRSIERWPATQRPAAGTAAAGAAACKPRPLDTSSNSGGSSSRPPLAATCTPPQLLEQPAKRSRMCDASAAAAAGTALPGRPAPPPPPLRAHRPGPGLAARAMILLSPQTTGAHKQALQLDYHGRQLGQQQGRHSGHLIAHSFHDCRSPGPCIIAMPPTSISSSFNSCCSSGPPTSSSSASSISAASTYSQSCAAFRSGGGGGGAAASMAMDISPVAAAAAAAGGAAPADSTPLAGWLQRLCGMLTPQADAVTAC